jgi:two-component system, cell cycle response regulator
MSKKPILSIILASPRLPTLPTVAIQVLELTRRSQVDMDEVANVIRSDQALAAKVLRTVNSSYYGLSRPCETIKEAIVYLGLNTVKTLVLGFSLVESINGGEGENITFDFVSYWRRAMLSAVAAREIAARARCGDPEAAFLGALMQDLGMVAMYRSLGDKYLQAVDMSEGDHRRLPGIEQRAFEFDHAMVGAVIAAKWNLPPRFVDVIRHHHDARQAPPSSSEISRAVELAGQAAAALTGPHSETALATFNQDVQEWLGLGINDVKTLMTVVTQASEEFASLFHIDIGAMPNVETLLAEAEDRLTDLQAQLTRDASSSPTPSVALDSPDARDALTGVFARHVFNHQLNDLFNQTRSASGSLALIFGDLDQFHRFNEEHGREAGDAAIAALGRHLEEQMSGSATLYRCSGNEFAVLLPGSDRVAAARFAELLRTAIENRPIAIATVDGQVKNVRVTMSLGVAVLEEASRSTLLTPSLLMTAADQAVCAAKSAGRNCTRVFGIPMRSAKVA